MATPHPSIAVNSQLIHAEYRRLQRMSLNPAFRYPTAERVLESSNDDRQAKRNFRTKLRVASAPVEGSRSMQYGVMVEYKASVCLATLIRAKSIIDHPLHSVQGATDIIEFLPDDEIDGESTLWAFEQARKIRDAQRGQIPAREQMRIRRYTDYANTGGLPPGAARRAAGNGAAATNARANAAAAAQATAAAARQQAAAATAARQQAANAAAARASAQAAARARAAATARDRAAAAAAAQRRDTARAAAAAQAADTAAAERAAAEAADFLEALDRANPKMPPTVPIADNQINIANSQIYAIMAVDTALAIRSPFPHADDVPNGLAERYAVAEWQVHEWYLTMPKGLERECALRWIPLIHDILLRRPKRGGRRGRDMYILRFDAFEAGEYTRLVEWYLADRAAAVHRPYAASSESAAIQRAVRLVGEGEISRAANLLSSEGLADITDPAVVVQLKEKHPQRKKPLPGKLPNRSRPEIAVRCKGVYSGLERRCGTGPDNKRNEYLRALDRDFNNNARASEAILHHERFATHFVNGKLPRWYYQVQAASLIVASIKGDSGGDGATPDVRPIAMGNVGPRAWAKGVATDAKELFRGKLEPVQVAVGMPGGLSVMVVASRALLEAEPDFVAVEIDKRNCYNEVMRAAVLETLEDDEEMYIYSQYYHSVYSPRGPVYLGQDEASFSSWEGGRQGDPFFCSVYCLTTQKANLRLAKKMEALGGCSFNDVDDGIVIGPPAEVYKAVREYGDEVAILGEELNINKCGSYSRGHGAALEDQPGYDAAFPVRLDVNGEPGIMICGVPVGSDAFVEAALEKKVDDKMSSIKKISDKLQTSHLQSMHTILYSSSQHKMLYWAQHSYPSDSAAPLADFDARIEELLCSSHGGNFVMDDPLLNRRVRLPCRFRGEGMRRMVEVTPAAFVGMASLALPRCIDAVVNGVERKGSTPALEPLLGRSSFDDANARTRFAALATSTARLSVELRQSWTSMQLETSGASSGPADLLSVPFAAAGSSTIDGKVVDRLQRRLTREREEHATEVLNNEFTALLPDDARRTAWLSADEYSSTLFTALPAPGARVRNGEWTEAVAMYYGAPSPACSQHVGKPITVNGAVVAPLDKHGSLLLSHNRLINIGNGRTFWHDELKHILRRALQEAEVQHQCEVFNVFSAEMPPGGQQRAFSQYSTNKSRQGMVPDFMYKEGDFDRLGDVKTIGLCRTWYPEARLRSGIRGQCVEERARYVNKSVVRQAKQLDENLCGTPRGTVGPVQRKLDSFGIVEGLVFGAFGEVSEGVRKLVKLAASGVAQNHWMDMGAKSIETASAAIRIRFRRELAITNVRAHAHLKLRRLVDHVRNTHYGNSNVNSSSDRQYAARQTAYESTQGFSRSAGSSTTAEERRA